jgi:hypothetical protein
MYQLPGVIVGRRVDGAIEVEVYMGQNSYLFTVPPSDNLYWDCHACELGEQVQCAVKLRGERAKLVAIV